jgi:uncharacterized membrane protein
MSQPRLGCLGFLLLLGAGVWIADALGMSEGAGAVIGLLLVVGLYALHARLNQQP